MTVSCHISDSIKKNKKKNKQTKKNENKKKTFIWSNCMFQSERNSYIYTITW